jgi:small-conductance mechanosensitive channel
MDALWSYLTSELAATETLVRIVRATVLLVVGLLLARLASQGMARLLGDRLEPQQKMLLRRAVFYSLGALTLLAAVHALGVDMTIFLGAAGVLSLAVGFASQTSVANLIGGLFLIAERPFVVGEIVQVGDTTGEVLSIDLLSVRLRTFDNLFVRIPNEMLMKSQITNLTRFPIRRLDLEVPVAYGADLAHVQRILEAVADGCPMCLEEPPPLFIVKSFGDSAVLLQFSVWAARTRFLEVRNAVHRGILERFAEAGIEIPLPQRDLRPRLSGEPLEVRIVEGREA